MDVGFLWGLLIVVMLVQLVTAVGLVQCWIELKAMKNSTHQITYIDPLQQAFGKKPSAEDVSKMTGDPMGNIGLGDLDLGDDMGGQV